MKRWLLPLLATCSVALAAPCNDRALELLVDPMLVGTDGVRVGETFCDEGPDSILVIVSLAEALPLARGEALATELFGAHVDLFPEPYAWHIEDGRNRGLLSMMPRDNPLFYAYSFPPGATHGLIGLFLFGR